MRPLSRFLLLLLIVFVVIGSGTTPADASTKSRQRDAQRKKAQAAAKIDGLRATEAELERALDALNDAVRGEQDAVRDASADLRAATAIAQAARDRQAELGRQLVLLRATVRDAAVRSYTRGGADDLVGRLAAGSLSELVIRDRLLKVATARLGDLSDELRATRLDHEEERQVAERAETIARDRQREVALGLRRVETARNSKRRLADQAESRLERALAEAAALEGVDRRAAADLAGRQRGLAGRIGSDARGRGGSRPGSVSTTTVRGIVVATSIANQVEGLLDASSADGFRFGGGGYRDSNQQVAARRANCGTSDYDTYDKPASQCRPPTARPGQSMHEKGLAIDFTSGGSLIQSRDSPAFKWLQQNAGRFGLRNLPAEPWHWSTNGN